mmetsp:Transcript_7844/g.7328  ORF Transcript_7844/g.7328 Transcript_7844/m.7328 type:complete len:185 (-) Transcript_7844:36-590(-)
MEKDGKFVYACRANIESLPFDEGSFDSYLSSHVIALIDNPANGVKEAFRVLKSGGKAGFSVWGRTEFTQIQTIKATVFKNLGLQQKPNHQNYFGDNPSVLIEILRNAGFVNVKQWYEPSLLRLKSGLDFFNLVSLSPSVKKQLEQAEDIEAIKKEFEKEYQRISKSSEVYPNHFESGIFIAEKP